MKIHLIIMITFIFGNIQATFRQHSRNIQGTFREHSRNIQGTFRELSGNNRALAAPIKQ
jgi:hypothetical protein